MDPRLFLIKFRKGDWYPSPLNCFLYPRARDGALVAVDPVAEAGGEKPKKKKTAAPRATAPDQKAMPPRLPARARKPRASRLTRQTPRPAVSIGARRSYPIA